MGDPAGLTLSEDQEERARRLHDEATVFVSHDHDIVSAINTAIAVLKDQPSPAPFSINDKKEALFLLAHFLGDLHQPLHVGAVYLDASGNLVNPDGPGGLDPATETAGGNRLPEFRQSLQAGEFLAIARSRRRHSRSMPGIRHTCHRGKRFAVQ